MKFSHRPQAGKETRDVGVSLVATCGDKVCVTSGGNLLLLCLMYLCLSQALPHCNDATFPKKSQRDLQKMSGFDEVTKYIVIVGHILAQADMVNIPVLSSNFLQFLNTNLIQSQFFH